MTIDSDRKSEFFRFMRFCVVGVMNTAVTFVVFTVLRHFDVNVYVSNVLGYVAGVINSFLWNKKWVYRSGSRAWFSEALLFLLFFGICYGVQLVAFRAALRILPEWLAQLVGMGVYSVLNYILNRLITFKHDDETSKE